MKIYFRDKYLKKKEIFELAVEVEEILSEDEDIAFQNFNIKDEKYIQLLCGDPEMRKIIRDLLLEKQIILSIESDNKRYFGKYAQSTERERFKEQAKQRKNDEL